MPQVYFHSHVYGQLLDHLEHVARTFDPSAPRCLRSDLMTALGEVAAIWPMSIFEGEDEGPVISVPASA